VARRFPKKYADRPNSLGLCDRLGDVWEFCSTRYGEYQKAPVTDPTGGDEKHGFAACFGGWSNAPRDVRGATRNADWWRPTYSSRWPSRPGSFGR